MSDQRTSKKMWICTRCSAARGIALKHVLGIRACFGHETCPLCDNPGSGMEYVDVLHPNNSEALS